MSGSENVNANREDAVENKTDRCNLCAVEVKPDEQGEWNGTINDEGVVYCHPCDPQGPTDMTGVIQPPVCHACDRESTHVNALSHFCDECEEAYDEGLADNYEGMTDAEADADALASAGWGTDEDYGYFGGDE